MPCMRVVARSRGSSAWWSTRMSSAGALEVQSVWRTHGKGNVATGTAGVATLFSGQWTQGETLAYRFELPVSHWPPTYHGHYLNIDHYVDARAMIPWGFDPKASVPFQMRPICDRDSAKIEKHVTEIQGLVGFIIGIIMMTFLVVFVVGLAFAGPFAFIFLLFPLLGFLFWFFRKFLPRWVLGEVVAEFPVTALSPGEAAHGELTIEPKKSVSINGITLLLQAREQCVSGSGSNRTTHKHVLFEETEVLQEATTLEAGVKHRFPLLVKLPGDAAHSLDLVDNQLIWSATLRVDIPRWPDWVSEIPFTVAPSVASVSAGKPVAAQVDGRSTPQGAPLDRMPMGASETRQAELVTDEQLEEDGVTFAETASILWAQREERDQLDMLVEAVVGLSFPMEAIVERRLLYSGDDDPHVFQDGYAVWAHYTEPPLPLVLYVPHQLADEFEQIGRDVWRGRGTIIGWDKRHRRLQVKLEVSG